MNRPTWTPDSDETRPEPSVPPMSQVYERYAIWSVAHNGWHAVSWLNSDYTTDPTLARGWAYARPLPELDNEFMVPANALKTMIPAPSTDHTAESADKFVSQLASVLDGYAGLATLILDRHVRIQVCGWDYPCEGRTVSDVMTDVLHHIRTDHG